MSIHYKGNVIFLFVHSLVVRCKGIASEHSLFLNPLFQALVQSSKETQLP